MTPEKTDLQRTADHWSAAGAWEAGGGTYWLELPAVQHRLSQKVSGRADVDWVRYTLERHFAGRLPLERCLSLGCGEGGLERHLSGVGAFINCDAFDVAQGSIAKARSMAQQAGHDGIHYAVQDANRMELPSRYYDAVWGAGAIHHFERLEHVFDQIATALKPGGLFILNEYVGPTRFQFPPRQRQTIRACYDLLPVGYRRLTAASVRQNRAARGERDLHWWARRVADKLRDGDLLAAAQRRLRKAWSARSGDAPIKQFALPTARSVKSVDPSEAVRSDEILPLLRRYFEVVELKPLGGAILQFLLADIARNFQDQEGARLLEMLFAIEDALMACGDLASDFAYIVASPNGRTVSR